LIDKLVELILHVLHQAPPVLGKYGMMAARSALTYVCPPHTHTREGRTTTRALSTTYQISCNFPEHASSRHAWPGDYRSIPTAR
jgi:hypothetical protein